MVVLSSYEQTREANIARNKAMLEFLGIEKLKTKSPPKRPRKKPVGPARRSSRVEQVNEVRVKIQQVLDAEDEIYRKQHEQRLRAIREELKREREELAAMRREEVEQRRVEKQLLKIQKQAAKKRRHDEALRLKREREQERRRKKLEEERRRNVVVFKLPQSFRGLVQPEMGETLFKDSLSSKGRSTDIIEITESSDEDEDPSESSSEESSDDEVSSEEVSSDDEHSSEEKLMISIENAFKRKKPVQQIRYLYKRKVHDEVKEEHAIKLKLPKTVIPTDTSEQHVVKLKIPTEARAQPQDRPHVIKLKLPTGQGRIEHNIAVKAEDPDEGPLGRRGSSSDSSDSEDGDEDMGNDTNDTTFSASPATAQPQERPHVIKLRLPCAPNFTHTNDISNDQCPDEMASLTRPKSNPSSDDLSTEDVDKNKENIANSTASPPIVLPQTLSQERPHVIKLKLPIAHSHDGIKNAVQAEDSDVATSDRLQSALPQSQVSHNSTVSSSSEDSDEDKESDTEGITQSTTKSDQEPRNSNSIVRLKLGKRSLADMLHGKAKAHEFQVYLSKGIHGLCMDFDVDATRIKVAGFRRPRPGILGPAEASGMIEVGDELVAVEGDRLLHGEDFKRFVPILKSGLSVTLSFRRQ
ncbi:hypothetical protein AC1031_015946 [Aphanomyces cochlioides]|nr:hypothetical protein AC1031_015946 [Aphanomyces cochlioides]